MNTLQAIRLSSEHGKVSFFKCRDLYEAFEIALGIKTLAISIIGRFDGAIGVLAVPKTEVM